jgi:hypothetical protein
MTGAAWELWNEILPAELGFIAILEIFISSGKLKMVERGLVSSGGMS